MHSLSFGKRGLPEQTVSLERDGVRTNLISWTSVLVMREPRREGQVGVIHMDAVTLHC